MGVGIAVSGGGYRAFLNGAGMLAAFDDRSFNSTLPGHLGGILQGTSYIAGISGGSWIVMSLLMGDFKPLVRLRHEWDLFDPLLEGVPNINQTFEVSRNEVQVLPENFDSDPKFYDELRKVAKRDLEDDDDYDIEYDALYEEMEDLFYSNVSATLVKREDVWLEGFKSFFKDMLKRKENTAATTGPNMIPNIENSLDLSLKSMKKIFNFYKNLHLEVRTKKATGFPVSLTDYWGRALSRRIFPKELRSPNVTLTKLTDMESFRNFRQPFPIILSNLRQPGREKTPIDSNIFEFTPFEFGCWELEVFMNLKYLGSSLYNGRPLFHMGNSSVCFTGFDNAGFITGTSSSLFNNVFIYVWQMASTSSKNNNRAIRAVLNTFGITSLQDDIENPKKHPDYALYTPNPFYQLNTTKVQSDEAFNSKNLYMVDGGEDGQNIPYVPLLQNERGIDVIFSFDSTADVKGWPNGSIIANSALRFNHTAQKGVKININGEEKIINKFPDIPSPDIFLKKQLNSKPTFFGCHLDQYSTRSLGSSYEETAEDYLPPIIGYFGNSDYSYPSNTSTFKLTYDYNEVSGMMENAYNIVTYGNSTVFENYYKCIGCILIKREFDRKERNLSLINDMERPKFCDKCYEDYCYN